MQHSLLSMPMVEKMIDLNDLRIFAYVASLYSFSLAADALTIHKSSVSRSIVRLETMLETPLLERTTRKVRLTQRGIALKERCVEMLSGINETIGYVGSIDAEPNGQLSVRSGLGSLTGPASLKALGSLQGRGVAGRRAGRQDTGRIGAAA